MSASAAARPHRHDQLKQMLALVDELAARLHDGVEHSLRFNRRGTALAPPSSASSLDRATGAAS
jgi:hypothetical protein